VIGLVVVHFPSTRDELIIHLGHAESETLVAVLIENRSDPRSPFFNVRVNTLARLECVVCAGVVRVRLKPFIGSDATGAASDTTGVRDKVLADVPRRAGLARVIPLETGG
jgi:hypothetical protein